MPYVLAKDLRTRRVREFGDLDGEAEVSVRGNSIIIGEGGETTILPAHLYEVEVVEDVFTLPPEEDFSARYDRHMKMYHDNRIVEWIMGMEGSSRISEESRVSFENERHRIQRKCAFSDGF